MYLLLCTRMHAASDPLSPTRRRQLIGALGGLIGGACAPALSLLLTTSAWISGQGRTASILSDAAYVLALLTVPLLIFGGHCLDLLETPPRSRAAPVSTAPERLLMNLGGSPDLGGANFNRIDHCWGRKDR